MLSIQPVKQITFGEGHGNCWAACLASLLHMDVEMVPNFCGDFAPDWFEKTQEWLRERGLYCVEISLCQEHQFVIPLPPVHVIITGKSPRGDFNHCIVGRVDGGEIVNAHDPHPDGTFLDGEPKWIAFLAALETPAW